MSEELKDGSAVTEQEVTEQEKQSVSRKAYEEVSRDMHKNKQKAKELEEALNEMKTQLKVQEESKMQEQEQWKELYEKTKAEREEERSMLMQEKGRYTKSVKLSALNQELGGKVKSEYLNFADLDSITINDEGSIDAETLLAVANQYRKEHGQLIPNTDNTDITGHASSNLDNFKPKGVNDMSHEEKVAALSQIYSNKN